jgi:uncharacterized tellurite resistance protein B-like protein
MEFTTFFDIYMRPHTRERLERDGIEFRYAAAAMMIACSKSDMDEDPEEALVIRGILKDTFNISESTIDRLVEFGNQASEGEYLDKITSLVNAQFSSRDKRFLLEKLWQVAYADGRIMNQEKAFIDRIATLINLTEADVITAQSLSLH